MATSKDARKNETNVIVASEISFATKKEFRTKARNFARNAFAKRENRESVVSFVRRDKSRIVARIVATNESVFDNYDTYEYYVRNESAKETNETKLDKRNFYRYALLEDLVIVVANEEANED